MVRKGTMCTVLQALQCMFYLVVHSNYVSIYVSQVDVHLKECIFLYRISFCVHVSIDNKGIVALLSRMLVCMAHMHASVVTGCKLYMIFFFYIKKTRPTLP